MAKNYVQDGKTLTFIADENYKSGDMVRVGDRIVIAVTDTPKDCAGTGLAEGVFTLAKKSGETIQAGKRVYVYDNHVVANNQAGAVPLGTAWENAEGKAPFVAVKLFG
ncbi:DUF2190 family protein [Pantoea latae]|uniref:Recombinase RecA n=1 Tax=Pantoea latae TaxID=1964541 RepID=A0A1V9DEU5_9GAMM|nr:capsid cement protein [Pantoea latae]OQP32379.1 hypothetical protein B2J69_13990 [Pantoea latae]